MNLKFIKNYIDYYNDNYLTRSNKKKRRLNLIELIFIYFLFVNIIVCNSRIIVNALSIKSFDPIVWSTHNKMFESSSFINDRIIHKEHIIDVRIGEFLNIVCPKYNPLQVNSQQHNHDQSNKPEYHALYKVSKEEYHECKIKNIEFKHPILKCDRPNENVKYTMYISKFSPVPDAIEFTPGNSYYFISTSNGSLNGLHNSEDGTCKTNNMKIIVKVLDSKTASIESSNKKSKPNFYHYSNRKNENNKILSTSPEPNESFYSNKHNSIELQTRNIDPSSMILNSKFKFTKNILSTTESTTTTTLPTTTSSSSMTTANIDTLKRNTKTVNDNIFILEPDSVDYNDILSQLISSSSSSLNNSDSLNDKLSIEPLESINNDDAARSSSSNSNSNSNSGSSSSYSSSSTSSSSNFFSQSRQIFCFNLNIISFLLINLVF